MRTSCDIDILIKEENLDAAINALVQKGFKCGEKNYHDVSLYSPNKIHLELHFNIQENTDTLDVVLKDAWNYVTHSQGCCYEFTKEFFLFHMFAHMSYHLLSGGCGVKSLIDIWIMEHKMGITYLQAKGLLERAGIYVFATEISNLADACFSDQPQNDFSEMLLSYILDGGVYGSLENHIAINESKTHVNLSYIGKRIFIPCNELAIEYPILRKYRVLYLFCWLHRTLKLFTRLVKRTFKRKIISKDISSLQIEQSQIIRARLGL